MAGDTRKKKRRSYLDDYRKNAAGEYEYTGKWMAFAGTAQERKHLVLRMLVLCAASFAAGVVCGCIPAAGMGNCFYVILPYTVSLVACFRTLWAVCRLAANGDPLKEYVHTATVRRVFPYSAVWGGASLLALTGCAVFAFLHDGDIQVAATVGFCILEGGAAGCGILLASMAKKAVWQGNNE